MNFRKKKSDWLMFDLPYDGKSVMHYKFNNFGKGKPKKTTIESKASKHIIVRFVPSWL